LGRIQRRNREVREELREGSPGRRSTDPATFTSRLPTPSELRESLLDGDDSDRRATYFDEADVQEQGIPGGPGYEILVYDNFQTYVLVPEGPNGRYYGVNTDSLEPGTDTTFTHEQFVKFSRIESRRCRRET
jgi:hypothetical protein